MQRNGVGVLGRSAPQPSRSGDRASSSEVGSVPGYLELEDGSTFAGMTFGSTGAADGEVVFNTGMVGYVESLTDPSYRGQILVLTYPLVGNYGVPKFEKGSERFESDSIQVRGLVVANYNETYGHWEAGHSLGQWLQDHGVVGLTGIDCRELTKILRSRGTMLGRIVLETHEKSSFSVRDPNASDLVREVTARKVATYVPGRTGEDSVIPAGDSASSVASAAPSNRGGSDGPHVVVVDCGCKRSILRELHARGCRVTVVPYCHDLTSLECDGIMLSNGPGDPAVCGATIANVTAVLTRARPVPVAGICLGCQIMALAAGGQTYKLPYGHRGQNQPVRQEGTERCRITSQNHGYAVHGESLPDGWEIWFSNLNDGTVEGIRHTSLPFFAVQFHPEAAPGPTDSRDFFDIFLGAVRHG
jgi:carbamoyl-phosphate synthase small subunit